MHRSSATGGAGLAVRNIVLQQALELLQCSDRLHWNLGSVRLFRDADGRLRSEDLVRAWQELVVRQPVLAAAYRLEEGELRYCAEPGSAPEVLVMQGGDTRELARLWLELMQEPIVRGDRAFSRFVIARAKGGDCLLGLIVNHMLLDGQSLQRFWQSYGEALARRPSVAPALPHPGIPVQPPCLQLPLASRQDAPSAAELPARDRTYWRWLVEHFCADPARRSAAALLSRLRHPVQIRCGPDHPLQHRLARVASSEHTSHENAVAALLGLLAERVGLSELLVLMPVVPAGLPAGECLGYWIDARPLPLLELADSNHAELCAQLRAGLRRASSLPDPWLSRFAGGSAAISSLAAGSLLISQQVEPFCPTLMGVTCTAPSDEDLRQLLPAGARPGRGRQSLTARSPVLTLQYLEREIVLRTNVGPLAEAVAELSFAADPCR